MSSILEALKKLEEEKAARRGGLGHIAGRVASGRRAPAGKRFAIPAAMAGIAIAAVVGTYLVMGGLHKPAGPAAVAQHQADRLESAGTGVTTGSAPTPEQPEAQTVTIPRPPQAAAPRETTPPAAPAQKPTTAAPAGQEGAPAPAVAGSTGEQAPGFQVTGIAWQKDEAFRLAVVNGFSVSQGTLLDGAVVEEILPDHVRFSMNGKEFRVYMGKIPPMK